MNAKRQQILNYFRQVAVNENSQLTAQTAKSPFDGLVDPNDKHRVLAVLPESAGDVFLATSLFKSIRERYPRPEWTFYMATKPEYKQILDGNPYIDKYIPYGPMMDNLIYLEGNSTHDGFFDISYLLHGSTQRFQNYQHSSIDKIDLNLK